MAITPSLPSDVISVIFILIGICVIIFITFYFTIYKKAVKSKSYPSKQILLVKFFFISLCAITMPVKFITCLIKLAKSIVEENNHKE
jgi:hypothetical protein